MRFCVIGPALPISLEVLCSAHSEGTWKDLVNREQRKRTIAADSHGAAFLEFIKAELTHPETGRLAWWVCDRESSIPIEIPTGGNPDHWGVGGAVIDWNTYDSGDDWQGLDFQIILTPAGVDEVNCCDAAPKVVMGTIGVNSYRHDRPGGCAFSPCDID